MEAIFARLLSFIFVLSLLPIPLVPFFVKFSILISFVLFFLPALDFFSFINFLENSGGVINVSWQVVFAEISIGFLLAVVVGASAYAAFLFASWLSKTLFSDKQEENPVLLSFIFLFFVSSIFHLPGFSSVYAFFANSLTRAFSNLSLIEGLAYSATLAFQVAAILIIPLVLASLCVSLFFLILSRYSAVLVSSNLARGVSIPILLLVLSLSFATISTEFSQLLVKTLSWNF